MTEEKQEKKKRGIIKRIFGWIWLGLLVALILGTLIYDAPWKVLALLLIILAASTILPKGTGKWFWLSVAAVVVILIIWVFLPDETGGWRPFTFDEELASLKAKYAVPDSENAARIYNELLQQYDANGFRLGFLTEELDSLTLSEPWSSRDYPKLAEWLQQHENLIAKLKEASKIKECRFPISCDYVTSLGFGASMSGLSAMKNWGRSLIRAANNDLADNRTDQAIEKDLTVLQMAQHLYQQPTTIDMLLGIAMEAMAIRQLNRFVITEGAAEEHLGLIENALAEIEHNWTSDWPKIYEWENLLIKYQLCSIMYEINPEGKTRLSRDPFAPMRVALKTELQIKNEVLLRYQPTKLFKAKVIFDWFYMPSTPQEAAKIIDAAFKKRYETAGNRLLRQEEPGKSPMFSTKLNFCHLADYLISISESSFIRVHDIYLRVTTDNKGSRILIALRRYRNKTGCWPKTLEEVKPFALAEIFVDPFNNDSFIYKLTDDNFKLYSKGKNNIDEDGKRSGWGEEETGADDWPIWPPKSRKTRKENINAEQP